MPESVPSLRLFPDRVPKRPGAEQQGRGMSEGAGRIPPCAARRPFARTVRSCVPLPIPPLHKMNRLRCERVTVDSRCRFLPSKRKSTLAPACASAYAPCLRTWSKRKCPALPPKQVMNSVHSPSSIFSVNTPAACRFAEKTRFFRSLRAGGAVPPPRASNHFFKAETR